MTRFGARVFTLALLLFLPACTTNPATGESQFTALMSPEQEVGVGSQEHEKVIKEFGEYDDPALQAYVRQVGARVSARTERPEVRYNFFLLDSPMVNAFALPGGYIYITRGLLALANSEAEMASVLAHETGHITARHSAARYSRGVVTSLGAAILASAVGTTGVSQALGVGSDLYMKSYSRGQENQADGLGIRYLSRAGYDPTAMSSFLRNLQADSALEARASGKTSGGGDYFSTHPATVERVNKTVEEARQYISGGVVDHDGYLRRLEGLIYGDSAAQGFVRGQNFYHTQMGFTFTAPEGFKILNQPQQVIVASQSGALFIFDMAGSKGAKGPMDYLRNVWMQGEAVQDAQVIQVNGLEGATASFAGKVNGKPMTIRLVAIGWSKGQVARFQIAYPRNAPAPVVDALKRVTYSFRRLSPDERQRIRPLHLEIVTARAGDNVSSLAGRMALPALREEHFRVLNGLGPQDGVVPGRLYKIVVE
ncbi:MAG: M48 family metalloprotease [Alphaproteobacteria bacterium]|nr:M48 family metalloprotease [Alphaproteobacteria bacterium]